MADEISKPGGYKMKGRRKKQGRAVKRSAKDSLDYLYRIFYEIKIAEGRAPRTLKQYDENFGYFLSYLEKRGVEASIGRITRDTIRGYITYMRGEIVKFDGHKYKPEDVQTVGLAIPTINTRLKTLRVFFSTMQEEGYVFDNPMRGVKNLREEVDEIEVLDADELRTLLAVPDQRYFPEFRDYALMYFLFDGMARISEALALKISDFDLSGGLVTIPASVAKNRKARTLYLQDRTISLVKELYAENKADFDTDYVFVNNYGDPLTADNYRNRLKDYAKRAGIRKNVRPHIFRHTAATMFLENGGDIRHLQLILGHSDIRMVLRYTHISNRSIRRQQAEYSPMNAITGKLNKKRKTKRSSN